jgi:hypothetical protein
MDDATLATAFQAHKEGQTRFTRRMAIIIADMADMRPMSLVWRLEKMGLLKCGSWEWFKLNGGITQAHIDEVRGDIVDHRNIDDIPAPASLKEPA